MVCGRQCVPPLRWSKPMQLKTISYQEFGATPNVWSLHEMATQQFNLIVGRNASGKTRSLNVINSLAKLVSGRFNQPMSSADFRVTFAHGNQLWKYRLHIDQKQVVEEHVERDGVPLLRR